MTRNDRIAAVAGKTYEATVWVKTTAGADARVALSFWDETVWKKVVGVTESAPHMVPTTGWRLLKVRGTAPLRARYLRLEMRLYGPGTLWADDVSVQAVSP